jgi:hypothetical protein
MKIVNEMGNGFRSFKDGSINSLLVMFNGIREGLLLFLFFEKLSLSLLLAFLLGLLEVSIVDVLGDSDLGNVELGLGGQDVGLVNTAKRNTVDLERSSHKKKSRRQGLQVDHALSTETTSQKNQDSSRGDGASGLRSSHLGVAMKFVVDFLGSIETRSLLGVGLGLHHFEEEGEKEGKEEKKEVTG